MLVLPQKKMEAHLVIAKARPVHLTNALKAPNPHTSNHSHDLPAVKHHYKKVLKWVILEEPLCKMKTFATTKLLERWGPNPAHLISRISNQAYNSFNNTLMRKCKIGK